MISEDWTLGEFGDERLSKRSYDERWTAACVRAELVRFNHSKGPCHVSRPNLIACRYPHRSWGDFRFIGTLKIDLAGDIVVPG